MVKVPSKMQLALGGMWCNVFGVSELLASPEEHKEAVVLLFLHGRFGSAERIEHIVHKTYEDAVALAARKENPQDAHETNGFDHPQASSSLKRSLIIVTLDQRNHGTRKISQKGQEAWAEGNLKHAQDMLAMQAGTAADCSFLADFLESFLFANDEARITKWAVTGISLGGHATWMVLKNDPRFEIGVPMLGCPSYRILMKQRAALNNLPYAAPYMPNSLLELLSRIDPDSVPYTSSEWVNPYLNKKILVLHGDKDELVPWEASRGFVDALQVGSKGRKAVVIEPGRGHETSALMISKLSKWIAEFGMTAA